MAKRTNLALSLALVLVTGLSCDRLTAPATTGGIEIVLLSPTGTSLVVSPRSDASESVVGLSMVGGNTANVLLDGVRVTVTGPTNKSTTVTTATGGFFQVTIDGLAPGSYTVVVEGIVGGKVGHYGETSNILVTAGNSTAATVSFPVFQPVVPNLTVTDTVEVLRFTVSYSAVPSATSYTVEWSTSPTMAGAQSKTVATTSTEVNVATEGKYYFTVRAVNATVAAAGLPSVPKGVQVFQSVASVTVSPASPAVTAGATQQFTFEARDADNVIVANPPVVWVSNNHNVATVNPTTGLATTITSGTAVISAVAKGTPGTATLTANPMAATKLVFTTQPANTTAGQAMATIQVAIQNPQNQTATNDNTTQVTIAFGNNAGNGTLGGTKIVTVVQGVAEFTLNVDKTGTGYTLSATSGTLASVTSAPFNITPAGANRLAFIIQPSTVTAGGPISPAVQVEVRDALDNRAVGSSDAVTLAIGTNPSTGTLSGTKTVNAINGVASFSGLSIDKDGTGYTLGATSGSLNPTTSSTFNVTSGVLARVAVTSQVASATTDDVIQLQVSAQDDQGNLVSTAIDVVVVLGANPGGATLTGGGTQTTVAGQATFNLQIDKVGAGYTLVATSGVLASGVSNPIDIGAGAPAQLAFTTQPAVGDPQVAMNIVEVSILDASGNVTRAEEDITLAIGTNAGNGALTGSTTVLSSSGVAAFTDLVIDSTGSGYTLVASGGGLPGAISASFDLTLRFVQVRPGDRAICGVTSAANGYCWGIGNVGDIGDGAGINRNVPSLIAGDQKWITAIPGFAHSCGITASDSTAYCWGWNSDGQIGSSPVSFGTVLSPVAVETPNKFWFISPGSIHTCALRTTDSTAFCWGQQQNGRLGNGVGLNAAIINPVAVSGGIKFVAISAGDAHTCAIRADNRQVMCWGQQANGRLGNNLTAAADIVTPNAVNGTTTFLDISAGLAQTCGVRVSDRRPMCWGNNSNGQLGSGAGDVTEKLVPTVVANNLRFASIRTGNLHTCGVTTSGDAFCWGSEFDGRLGNGGVGIDQTTPANVFGGRAYTWVGAAATGGNGAPRSCGLAASGGVFCWGRAPLGDATNVQSAIPVHVKGTP